MRRWMMIVIRGVAVWTQARLEFDVGNAVGGTELRGFAVGGRRAARRFLLGQVTLQCFTGWYSFEYHFALV